MLAVQFEFHFWDAAEDGYCGFDTHNSDSEESDTFRIIRTTFSSNGKITFQYEEYPVFTDFAVGKYDETINNTITLIFLGDKIAAYINGQFAYMALSPDGTAMYTRQGFVTNSKIVCEFDNYRLWDLSGLNLNP